MTGVGRKTLVELDPEVLAEARTILGTRTIKETVGRALVEVVTAAVRRRHAERMAAMGGSDLLDPEVVGRAWC